MRTNETPKLMLVNNTFGYGSVELIHKFRRQNPILLYGTLKVVKPYEGNRSNVKYYNAFRATDRASIANMLSSGKLCIGWEKCKVFDGVNVRMCFKFRG